MVSENAVIAACIAAALVVGFGPSLAGLSPYSTPVLLGILIGIGVVLPAALIGYLRSTGRVS